MSELPRGTVTFLMTDVEGSTDLWHRYGTALVNRTARLRSVAHAGQIVCSRVVADVAGSLEKAELRASGATKSAMSSIRWSCFKCAVPVSGRISPRSPRSTQLRARL